MNQSISEKNNLTTKINYFLILILPISLLSGSAVINVIIIISEGEVLGASFSHLDYQLISCINVITSIIIINTTNIQ